MNTEIKELTERCDRLTQTVGTMIGWLQMELGQESAKALLDTLHGTGEPAPKDTVPLDDIKPLIAALSAITDTDDWRGVAKALVAAHRFLDIHPEATP